MDLLYPIREKYLLFVPFSAVFLCCKTALEKLGFGLHKTKSIVMTKAKKSSRDYYLSSK